jgi:hypothetical protein
MLIHIEMPQPPGSVLLSNRITEQRVICWRLLGVRPNESPYRVRSLTAYLLLDKF